MGWIHNICGGGGGGGGGGSHSFFHGDNEDRTRHMERFARNGSRRVGGASSRERRQQYPGRLRLLESVIPQSMSLVGTWILPDFSQSGGLDFRFVVAMVESPKGVPFPLSTLAKKKVHFSSFYFYFIYLSRSLFFSFSFTHPQIYLGTYPKQSFNCIGIWNQPFLFFLAVSI
jgi:hypothetical protein